MFSFLLFCDLSIWRMWMVVCDTKLLSDGVGEKLGEFRWQCSASVSIHKPRRTVAKTKTTKQQNIKRLTTKKQKILKFFY